MISITNILNDNSGHLTIAQFEDFYFEEAVQKFWFIRS